MRSGGSGAIAIEREVALQLGLFLPESEQVN